MSGRVLIVDDDRKFADSLARSLRRLGHDVTSCGSAKAARDLLSRVVADTVVIDYQLPDEDGLNLLEEFRTRFAGATFVVATAFPDVDVAVKAMRRGAFDYVQKGSDPRECNLRVERAVDVSQLRRRAVEAEQASSEGSGLLGSSAAMEALKARMRAVARSDDVTVLVVGETGTGKGLVARAIHAQSPRSYEPFVAVDCTTLPPTLIESELFGHERGSFSGAVSTKQGRVEVARRGTLFLDEIGELEAPVQAKLLRLLEEREFTRVGGTRPRTLEARIVTATNRDLAAAVQQGRFRADLRYRLEVFVVETPPLRKRDDDVLLLADHFVRERSRTLGHPISGIAPEVRDALMAYAFPGNVRELRNMIEQAVLLTEGDELTLKAFPVLRGRRAGGASGQRSRRRTSSIPPVPSSLPPRPRSPSSVPPAQQTAEAPAMGLAVAGGRVSSTFLHPPLNPEITADSPPSGADRAAVFSDETASLSTIRNRHVAHERETILRALEDTGGNVSAAARKLGMSRYQLIRRLKKHELSR